VGRGGELKGGGKREGAGCHQPFTSSTPKEGGEKNERRGGGGEGNDRSPLSLFNPAKWREKRKGEGKRLKKKGRRGDNHSNPACKFPLPLRQCNVRGDKRREKRKKKGGNHRKEEGEKTASTCTFPPQDLLAQLGGEGGGGEREEGLLGQKKKEARSEEEICQLLLSTIFPGR